MDETWLLHFTLQNPIDSQPSRLNAMNLIQSVEIRNGQLERLWYQYSGMRVVFYYHRLPLKGPDHQQRVLHSVIGAFKR
jgi:hypothetical protein